MVLLDFVVISRIPHDLLLSVFTETTLHYRSRNVLFVGLIIAIILSILFAAISVLITNQRIILFFVITMLSALNIGAVINYYQINLEFNSFVSRIFLSVLALLILVIVATFPFIISSNYVSVTPYALLGEVILFAVILILGIAGVRYSERQLAKHRDLGPSNEEILISVEQLLMHQGQVSADSNFPTLPRNQVVDVFKYYFAIHRSEQGMEFEEQNGLLRYIRHGEIKNINDDFENLRESLQNELNFARKRSKVDRLVASLYRAFQFERYGDYDDSIRSDEYFVFSTTAPNLESVLKPPFPLIIFTNTDPITTAKTDELKKLLHKIDLPQSFAVLVVIEDVEACREQIRAKLVENIGGYNLVILGNKDCFNIITSKEDIRLAFMNEVQTQVDLTIFSPYRIGGPVPKDMFYGRRKEIKKVLDTIDGGSVIVRGPRRIGKTSTLRILKHELEERGNIVLSLDLQAINNYETLFSDMATEWEHLDLDFTIFKNASDFNHLVNKMKDLLPGKKIIFQFDEIDQLLVYDGEYDRNENLFRRLRSLASEQKCQFVFSGERKSLERLSNPSSPFFNFVTPVNLGLLDLETTQKLIIEPMNLIGIQLENKEKIVEVIHNYTSGHPFLIQLLCEQVLNKLSSGNRTISKQKLRQVYQPNKYRQTYLDTFWSQSGPLDKAISVCVAELGKAKIGVIRSHLDQIGIPISGEELQNGLRYLDLCFVLKSTSNGFEIRFNTFYECLTSIYPFEQWYNDFRSKL